MNAGAELIGQRLGAFEGPVGDMDALDAALDQAEHHRARRSRRRRAPAPPRPCPSRAREASRLLMKPSTSVLVDRSSPSSNHSVLAAPTALARASGTDSASALLLVRNGDVGADEAARRQTQNEIRELLRRHRLDDYSRRRCRACAASNGGSAASANARPAIRSGTRRGVCGRQAFRSGKETLPNAIGQACPLSMPVPAVSRRQA